MPKFIRHIRNLLAILGNLEEQRPLVFYSEGKNYWVHLEGLIKEFLATSEVPVCYISSSSDDPGLHYQCANYSSFEIDEGFIRDWLFANMDVDVVVMTMPDLNQYQVKRSKKTVHYVYVQHSLVSMHMVYRPHAFDAYDTIFCAGPHHIREMRAIEAKNGLPQKRLIEHGYSRLDAILAKKRDLPESGVDSSAVKHILIAPSWGSSGTIESGVGARVVEELLARGYRVTLRPHPQTLIFAKAIVDSIIEQHKGNPSFEFEGNVAGQSSLHDSHLMISDWSGAALDYAFGLGKPVLFIDVPRKVNDPSYTELGIEPIESSIRDVVGMVIPPDFSSLPIEECLAFNVTDNPIEDYVYNISNSSPVGARYLRELLLEFKA
ncbi:MAG: hypothetical protein ABJ084_10580 [Halioglobus sp.]